MLKEELIEKIKKYNNQYWNEGISDISDVEYDKLIEELRAIDPENDLIVKIASVSITKKVKHSKRMLSLAKAYSFEEVLKWCKKIARSEHELFLVQPKYDGLSGLLEENGVLSSRGDGEYGEDYTDRLPIIKFVNATKNKRKLGEILVTNADWDLMQEKKVIGKSGSIFKNQRNAVAGIIGTDDAAKFYSDKWLTFIEYGAHSAELELKTLEKVWDKLVEKIRSLPFPLDGIVIKLKDEEYSEQLGATDHHPRGAIAFKFTNQSKWTKLIGYTWTMGKDQLAMIGNVEPIDLTGTTVRHVKLQLTKPMSSQVNSYVLDGSLQIGDEVLVERAGDIVPHIVKSNPGKDRKRIPVDVCPFCGSKLIINESTICCSNDNCERKITERVLFAMRVLGFKQIGDYYAKALCSLLNVKNVYDLMTVTEKQLRSFKEFGDKNVDIFLGEQKKALENSTLEQVIVAMNIPSCGNSVMKKLIEEFGPEKTISGELAESDMLNVKGIGKVAAAEASLGLKNQTSKIKRTVDLFKLKKSTSSQSSSEKICFTGKMEHKRSELESLAEKSGFQPVDGISVGTILVCADPNSNSSKMKNAKKLGCKIISEQEFFKLIGK